MDVRQFDLFIDGRRLPGWFLRNEDTEMGVKTYMRFDGLVERFELDDEMNEEPPDVYDPLPEQRFTTTACVSG